MRYFAFPGHTISTKSTCEAVLLTIPQFFLHIFMGEIEAQFFSSWRPNYAKFGLDIGQLSAFLMCFTSPKHWRLVTVPFRGLGWLSQV